MTNTVTVDFCTKMRGMTNIELQPVPGYNQYFPLYDLNFVHTHRRTAHQS